MDDNIYFNEEDCDKFIDFLNFITKETEFKKGFDIPKSIEFFRLLNYMQTRVLSKMKDNVLEVKEYIKNKEELPEIPSEE